MNIKFQFNNNINFKLMISKHLELITKINVNFKAY